MPLTIFSKSHQRPTYRPILERWRQDTHNVLHNLRLLSEDGHLKMRRHLVVRCGKNHFDSFRCGISSVVSYEWSRPYLSGCSRRKYQMADKGGSIHAPNIHFHIHYERDATYWAFGDTRRYALREMIYNSLVHKLYAGVPSKCGYSIIMNWNEGKLPDAITIDTLVEKHSSHPRNQLIASVFYKPDLLNHGDAVFVRSTKPLIK